MSLNQRAVCQSVFLSWVLPNIVKQANGAGSEARSRVRHGAGVEHTVSKVASQWGHTSRGIKD